MDFFAHRATADRSSSNGTKLDFGRVFSVRHLFLSSYEGRCAPQHIDNLGWMERRWLGTAVGVKVIHSLTGIDSLGMGSGVSEREHR